MEKMYRYEAKRYSVVIDHDAELYGVSDVKLVCEEYQIAGATPKGNWIGFMGGKDRWVSRTSRKRYAHETKEAALAAYKIRKEYYVHHCKVRLKRAEEDLNLVGSPMIQQFAMGE